MIQDIKPHKLNNHFDPEASPDKDSIILFYTDAGILCHIAEKNGVPVVRLPILKEFFSFSDSLCKTDRKEESATAETPDDRLIYAFSLDSRKFFLFMPTCSVEERIAEKPEDALKDFSFCRVRELRAMKAGTQPTMFAIMTGLHLFHWYRKNRYCGCCGRPLVHDERERALRCPSCGNMIYPRICPAVIVGVLNGDRILVTKYRTGFPHYALVAGFTEIGETLEETVIREVMEETGLHVKNIRYYKSQPWGIADDLLAGFYCEVDGSDTIHMDEQELKLAEWKTRDEIELQPDDMSLTNEMMEQFKNGGIISLSKRQLP